MSRNGLGRDELVFVNAIRAGEMFGKPLGVMVDHHLVKVLQDESKAYFFNFHLFLFYDVGKEPKLLTNQHFLESEHLKTWFKI